MSFHGSVIYITRYKWCYLLEIKCNFFTLYHNRNKSNTHKDFITYALFYVIYADILAHAFPSYRRALWDSALFKSAAVEKSYSQVHWARPHVVLVREGKREEEEREGEITLMFMSE